jgi:hypothetical protein
MAMYRINVHERAAFKTPHRVLRGFGVEPSGKKADMYVDYRKYIENCGLFTL